MIGCLFAVLLLSTTAAAQQYVVSTYAGGGPVPTPVRALEAPLGFASTLAADLSGNVYIASPELNSVFKLDAGGVLTRVAGNSRRGYSGDGGPAINATLQLGQDNPLAGLAVDTAGNLFISDTFNSRIRRVSPSGVITTVAGGGVTGLGDGGPATSAALLFPTGVAVDGEGNLFIADLGNNRVRKVSRSGIITTLAGGPQTGFSGDGGPAGSAALNQPRGVAIDGAGNLYIADSYNFSIRKISPSGIISTVAGDGTRGLSSDGGRATAARMDFPTRVSVDSGGNLFIADGGRVRKVSTDGTITTVAGDGTCCYSGDGGAATRAQVFPGDIAADAAGNLFIGGFYRVRKVSSTGIISTVAGNGSRASSFGDGGPATSARLQIGGFDPATVGSAAIDSSGNLFIADSASNRVRKVSASGIITTVAGTGFQGYSGDGGPATSAQLNVPLGVAVDNAGNLFIADWGVYVAGQAGLTGFSDFDFLPTADRANRAFLAKFEKSPAPVTLTSPRIFPDCVVNAASYVGGGVAPGEIVTLFGAGMGPSQLASLQLTQNGTLATSLAATRILFNGVPAPLLYVSDRQSSAIVPYAVAGRGSVDVQVEYQGVQSEKVTVPVLPSRPGIFSLDSSGRGQAAILNEDGSLNSPSNPAARGSIITIFGTGGGEAAAGVAEGQIVGDILPRTSLPVSVSFDIGDEELTPKQGEVLYAGGSRGSVVGLLQVNVRVPANAVVAYGMANFALTIGSQWEAFQVSVALR